MVQKYFLLFMALGLMLQACKSSKPVRPQEYYDKMESENKVSVLNLPVRIHRPELEKVINEQLGDVLFEDNELRGDGLMIKATKMADITLEVEGKTVKYKVPIDLWVRKDIAITSVDAEGALELEFVTNFEVKPDWEFITETEITTYTWVRKPVVKLGIGNLNVTSIANQFIEQAKGDIATQIDTQVRELFDLKTEVAKAWKEIQEPFLVSEEHSTWLFMNPTSVGLTPLTSKDDQIQSTVVISSIPHLKIGERPTTMQASQLPDFQFLESSSKDDFTIFLSSEIPFHEAERLSRENMIGETFSYGKRTVKIEDIELYGQGNKLVVKTSLSGSYNGDIYLIGKPEYNARKNKVELEKLEFEASTKKALLRSAAWLFKGSLKRKIQDEMNFYLTQNLDDTSDAIQSEMEKLELAPGLELHGELSDLSVSNVYIGAEAIHVKVGMYGKLTLELNGIATD